MQITSLYRIAHTHTHRHIQSLHHHCKYSLLSVGYIPLFRVFVLQFHLQKTYNKNKHKYTLQLHIYVRNVYTWWWFIGYYIRTSNAMCRSKAPSSSSFNPKQRERRSDYYLLHKLKVFLKDFLFKHWSIRKLSSMLHNPKKEIKNEIKSNAHDRIYIRKHANRHSLSLKLLLFKCETDWKATFKCFRFLSLTFYQSGIYIFSSNRSRRWYLQTKPAHSMPAQLQLCTWVLRCYTISITLSSERNNNKSTANRVRRISERNNMNWKQYEIISIWYFYILRNIYNSIAIHWNPIIDFTATNCVLSHVSCATITNAVVNNIFFSSCLHDDQSSNSVSHCFWLLDRKLGAYKSVCIWIYANLHIKGKFEQ